RWIYTYFKYFKESRDLFLHGLKKLNFNQMLFGFTLLRPPLFITLGIAMAVAIMSYFIHPLLGIAWAALLVLFALTFVLVISTQSRQKGMTKALIHIPKIVARQLFAFLQLKKAGREFLKTEHEQVVYIEDILKNEIA
ncbi:MAG: hypothetical protein ACJ748_02605, partial [Flavisolibacter sp.]